MKKLILSHILFAAVILQGQTLPSQNQNYAYSKTYLSDPSIGTPRIAESVSYFDGLGRLKQEVEVKSSPLGRDVVTHTEYEADRKSKDFLPVPQQGTLNGQFYSTPLANATNANLYGTEKIYAEKFYDNSPLERITQQKQVGTAWESKPINFGYAANNGTDKVVKFIATSSFPNDATTSMLSSPGNYIAGVLYKETVTDEDGNVTINFKDGKNQVILTRKVLDATKNADTYYVYDNFEQLAFVLPPLASAAASVTTDVLNKLCYQYRYDGKGRLVEKKFPGKDWEYMVYDKADKIVLSQDFGLRAQGKWLITKYDKLGRMAYSGFITVTTGETRASFQSQIGGQLMTESRDETGFTKNGMLVYYTNTLLGTKLSDVTIINYYDTYPPQGTPSITGPILGQDLAPQTPVVGSSISTKGLKVAVYIKNTEDDNWTKNYIFYDSKGRVILNHSNNHLNGYTKVLSQLDFTGILQRRETYHRRTPSAAEKRIIETFEYDLTNRLLKHTHQVDDAAAIILVNNSYNELSQLSNKKVGSNLQSIDYKYNIRGWMTKINDPTSLGTKLFAYEIKYNNPAPGVLTLPKYNGNIAEVDWKTASDGALRRYSYVYDRFDRLRDAIYSKPDITVPPSNAYGESATYDINGNISNLTRYGDLDANTGAKIDDISYIYDGNSLTSANDSTPNPSGLNGGGAITYDNDGRMLTDAAHSMTATEYNNLNLLKKIKRGNDTFSYNYKADGSIVQATSLIGTQTSSTEYLDGFQYKDAILQFVPTPEGYYDYTKNRYIYQYKDQLQNVRVSFFAKGTSAAIFEENNYYPFGLRHKGYNGNTANPNYKYGFQNQELQDTGFINFKWRGYMPDLGRFFTPDPLSDKYPYQSHYNFSENRVIDGNELEGLEWVPAMFRFIPLVENSSIKPVVEPIIDIAVKTGEKTVNDHHLIPRQFKGNEIVREARNNGFKFEGKENKIPLEAFRKATGEGRHASHPRYNEQIKDLLKDITKSNALEGLRNLRDKAKDVINSNPESKINDLKLKTAPPVKTENTKKNPAQIILHQPQNELKPIIVPSRTDYCYNVPNCI